jgi:4-carboxymuconolactone decarboxylase
MYLPEIFQMFMENHPEITDAYRKAGELCSQAGPLDTKTQHLVQMGVSIGMNSKGGVRSHCRRALDAGATEDEVIQAVLMSLTIVGFPVMISAYGWVQDVLAARAD